MGGLSLPFLFANHLIHLLLREDGVRRMGRLLLTVHCALEGFRILGTLVEVSWALSHFTPGL